MAENHTMNCLHYVTIDHTVSVGEVGGSYQYCITYFWLNKQSPGNKSQIIWSALVLYEVTSAINLVYYQSPSDITFPVFRL